MEEPIDIERAGWESLCDGRGGRFYGEIMKNLELAKLNLLKETPLVQVIDRPVLPLKKEKKGRLMGLIVWGFVSFILVLCIYYVKFLFERRKKITVTA